MIDDIKDAGTDREDSRPGLVELVYGTLFTPASLFGRIGQNPPVGLGLIIFVVLSVLNSLVFSMTAPAISDLSLEIAHTMPRGIMFFASLLFAVMFLFVRAGVLHLIAELLGGKARAAAVLVVLVLADIPGIINIPLRVAGSFLGDFSAFSFLSGLVTVAVFVWSLVLLVIGLRETEGFSTGRAVAVLLVPVGFIILLTGVVIFALVAALSALPLDVDQLLSNFN